MKSINPLLFLLVTLFFTAGAIEKQVFVGNVMENGQEKPAFLLDVLDEEIVHRAIISESGELYIRVNSIVTMPISQAANFSSAIQPTAKAQTVCGHDEELEITCSKCRYNYVPRSANGRKCPRCSTVN